MSRKYMNDRWCVRCGKKDPTPYLRDNYKHFPNGKGIVVDIGCGNGRNSEFMKDKGHEKVWSYDMANDYGFKVILGQEEIPVGNGLVDIILCNYSLMFLSDKERKRVIRDIKRMANEGCTIMVELYPAKDSYCRNDEEMVVLQKDIFDKLGWDKIRYSKGKFIARKP